MDILGRCGGVRGRMIGCGEASRKGQVSGNGEIGTSGWVIGGTSGSNWASRQTSGHDEQMQRDVGRSGQMQRGRK